MVRGRAAAPPRLPRGYSAEVCDNAGDQQDIQSSGPRSVRGRTIWLATPLTRRAVRPPWHRRDPHGPRTQTGGIAATRTVRGDDPARKQPARRSNAWRDADAAVRRAEHKRSVHDAASAQLRASFDGSNRLRDAADVARRAAAAARARAIWDEEAKATRGGCVIA